MSPILFLASRYLVYYRGQAAAIVASLSLILFLPLGVGTLVDHYTDILTQRADDTPFIVGAPGSRYDLVLNSLYFKGETPQTLPMQAAQQIRDANLAIPIPLHIRYTTGGFPIVGTTPEYFQHRRLRVKQGRLPTMLGEVVVGAKAAETLSVALGDTILSDDRHLYDISSDYPLSIRVVGVLKRSGTPDDKAVFTDVKTTWVLGGIGHGHKKARDIMDPNKRRGGSAENLIMSPAVVRYQEITRDNLDRFHFHGDQSQFPLTAVIVLPKTDKAATILQARYHVNEELQLVEPREVVRSLLQIVFFIERSFNTLFLVVLLSTSLLFMLIILLSLRMRRNEFTTLRKIGCSKARIIAALACELTLLFVLSIIIAVTLTEMALFYVQAFRPLL